MPALSWIRFARRLPGLVRQRELPHLEALIDLESGRQPAQNYFILSCAIPACIATFGGLSVFFAWVSGNRGLPLVLGTLFTVALSGVAWFIFFRLYKSVPASKRQLRKLIMKLAPRYGSFANILGGDRAFSEKFESLLDEAAGIYLRHCENNENHANGVPAKALRAIEEAMTRLMEVAVSKDRHAQEKELVWVQPMLEEMRLLDASLTAFTITAANAEMSNPLSGLRDARAEMEMTTTAIQELSDHITT